MKFYKAVGRTDASRRAMIKDAVLGLELELQGSTANWNSVRERHVEKLISRSERYSPWHLKQWADCNQGRKALVLNPPGGEVERHRVAYVLEGMEVFEEVMRFTLALANRDRD